MTGILRVAWVEDDPFIQECIAASFHGERVQLFESPEAFTEALARGLADLADLDAVVLDFHFGARSSKTGAEAAARLRELRPDLPLILCSDGVFDYDTRSLFNGVMRKDIVSPAQLRSLL